MSYTERQPVFDMGKLKDLRIKKGMSCAKLASEAGVHRKYIHCLEKGTSKDPSYSTVARFSRALGVSMDIFMNELSL